MRMHLCAGLYVAAIATLARGAARADYLGPVAVEASADGGRLFVAAHDAGRVLVVDPIRGEVVQSITVPGRPTALALCPKGKILYVTCAAPMSTVCAIEVATGAPRGVIPVGHTASGLAVSPDGRCLYVCNRFENNVSVVDLGAGREVGRVPAVREPLGASVTPDGATVFVINHLPRCRADSFSVAACVTAIDTATRRTTSIALPNGSTGVRGICTSPDGKYVYVVHALGRYQMPATQLERGWLNTNAMSIIDARAKKLINTVLLDDVQLGAADPWGVRTTADGAVLCVTHAGTHEISIIDARGLLRKLLTLRDSEESPASSSVRYLSIGLGDVPNDLAFLVGLRRRLRLGRRWKHDYFAYGSVKVNGPRGLAVVGKRAYVTSYFTDKLAVLDLTAGRERVLGGIDLGPEVKLSEVRRGEMLFHDAEIGFQKWHSCATCHPDGREDGLNWDLLNDGLRNPKNTRSLLFAHRTPPVMASGVRATAEEGVRAGLAHILFAVRPEEDAAAIDRYLKSLRPVASPYLVKGKLSAAAERGKRLFLSKEVGCAECHPPPLYTDKKLHNVGSRGRFDHRDEFDTPILIECWRTSPYMHDGHFLTIRELLTAGKHGHEGTRAGEMSEEDLNDVVQFVLSL